MFFKKNSSLNFIGSILFAVTILVGGFFVSDTVLAEDITAPTVSSYLLNDNPASVITNPLLHSVKITFNANKNVNWTSMKIENEATPSDHKDYPLSISCDGTSSCTQIWDGSVSGGSLTDGVYRVKVHITDATENEFNNYLTPYTITVDSTPSGPSDSSIPTTALYDKFVDTNLDIAMTLNGNTLTSIANGATTLTDTIDYNLSETTVTLTSAYMQAQSVGATTLTFTFSAGATDATVITVSDSTPVTHTLTYIPGAHGSITGILSQTVDQGTDGSEVTAITDSGYHFTNWSDAVETVARIDINVQADKSVSAVFAINTYTLTYTAGENGTITGTTSQTINYGSSGTTITAVPNTGYHFTNWSDGNLNATRTDENVNGDIAVTANFAVTSSHSSGGSYIRAIPATPATGQVLGAEKFNFTKFLKFKALSYKVSLQGIEVMELQKLLNNSGNTLIIDGKFGPKTKGAVIKFQLANKLVGDGIVGALTRTVLNK